MASRRRRRRMSSIRSASESSAVEASRSRAIEILSLRNDDDVAGADIEVVLVMAFGDFAVIELNAIGLRAVLSKHDDLVAIGELGQTLRAREELEHRGLAFQPVIAGHLHRAGDGHPE